MTYTLMDKLKAELTLSQVEDIQNGVSTIDLHDHIVDYLQHCHDSGVTVDLEGPYEYLTSSIDFNTYNDLDFAWRGAVLKRFKDGPVGGHVPVFILRAKADNLSITCADTIQVDGDFDEVITDPWAWQHSHNFSIQCEGGTNIVVDIAGVVSLNPYGDGFNCSTGGGSFSLIKVQSIFENVRPTGVRGSMVVTASYDDLEVHSLTGPGFEIEIGTYDPARPHRTLLKDFTVNGRFDLNLKAPVGGSHVSIVNLQQTGGKFQAFNGDYYFDKDCDILFDVTWNALSGFYLVQPGARFACTTGDVIRSNGEAYTFIMTGGEIEALDGESWGFYENNALQEHNRLVLHGINTGVGRGFYFRRGHIDICNNDFSGYDGVYDNVLYQNAPTAGYATSCRIAGNTYPMSKNLIALHSGSEPVLVYIDGNTAV